MPGGGQVQSSEPASQYTTGAKPANPDTTMSSGHNTPSSEPASQSFNGAMSLPLQSAMVDGKQAALSDPASQPPNGAAVTATAPSKTMSKEGQGTLDVIPGPLGLEAASLKGKVALVTGAGRGIGREMALELGRRGASVIVNYSSSLLSALSVVSSIRTSGSSAIAVCADVSDPSQISTLFSTAISQFGKLDIVVSNSGVVSFGHVKDVTPEEFDRVFSINTRGQFFVAREAYRRCEVGGRVVLMGSITGQAKGVPRHAVYSGSKGAIETFVRCMAVDFGDKKITVNCVAPGGIKTDMYHAVCREYIPNGLGMDDEQVDEYAATWSPLTRVGLPIDVARVVCFLASDDGGWINGKVLGIDGGACM